MGRLAQTLGRTGTMSLLPPMGEDAERRLRVEMADWTDSRLEAAAIKEPAFANGIAAKQILGARNATETIARHSELLREVRTPHWSVAPSFGLLVVTAVLSLAAVVLAALALPQVQQALWPSHSTHIATPGSQPAPANSPREPDSSRSTQQNTRAASTSASSPQRAQAK